MTGTVLTNNGLALITKLVAAKATLEFSRVAVGTGKVPQGVDPQAMISLNAYKMDAQISSYGVSPDQEDVAYIVTQVSSIGVSAGFAVTEGGVFANDPDKGEILFAYLDLTEDPQYVYAETDSISKFVEITFNVLIGSVEKVTAYVTPGALVKKVEFEELEKRVEETEKPTFEDYTGDTSVPAASAAIEEIKSKSKLGVLLSNIKAAFKGACLIGHIVNNCVTDRSDLPLSAAQGKALMDLYNVLNTKTEKIDMRQILLPNTSALTIKSSKEYDTIMILGQRGGKVIVDIIPLNNTDATVIHLGNLELAISDITTTSVTVSGLIYTDCRAIAQGILSVS